MFDLELFQRRVLEVMMPELRNQTNVEKETVLREYLKAIENEYNDAEIIMQDAQGYNSALHTYGKIEDTDRKKGMAEEIEDTGRKKKKRNPEFKDDFYKFQLREKAAKQAIDGKIKESKDEDANSDDDGFFNTKGLEGVELVDNFQGADEEGDEKLNEDNLLDGDYLKKRKGLLATSFQRQLAAINSKKLKL